MANAWELYKKRINQQQSSGNAWERYKASTSYANFRRRQDEIAREKEREENSRSGFTPRGAVMGAMSGVDGLRVARNAIANRVANDINNRYGLNADSDVVRGIRTGQQRRELEEQKAHAEEMYGVYSGLVGSGQTSPEEKQEALYQKNRFGAEAEDAASRLKYLDMHQPDSAFNPYRDIARQPDFATYAAKGAGIDNNYKTSEIEGAVTGWEFFNDEERDTYNYLLAKYGDEAALAYWEYMQTPTRQRQGQIYAQRLDDIDSGFGRALAKGAFGLGAGVENWMGGVVGAINQEEMPVSGVQYGSQMVSENLPWLGKVAYDLVYTTGNMLPSMLLSGGLGAAGAPAKIAGAVGSGAMGVSAGGNAYQQALRDGYSQEQARAYGAAIGASEAVMQNLLGGIGKLGGTSTAIAKKVAGIESGITRFIARTGGSILSEAGEEALQSILEPVFRSAIFGEDMDIDWAEVAYSALLGGLSGGVLEGPANFVSEMSRGQTTAPFAEPQNFASDGVFAPDITMPGREEKGGEAVSGETVGTDTASYIRQQQMKQQLLQRTYESAQKVYGKAGFDTFKEIAKTLDVPAEQFSEMTRTYNEGMTGRKLTGGKGLLPTQYQAMYNAGRRDAQASVAAQTTQRGNVVVQGGESGLVRDAYVKTKLDKQTANTLDTVAKALGVRVEFADKVAGGKANAQIKDGVVLIEKDNENPVRFLYGHEITHRMQELAPTEYSRLRDAIAADTDSFDERVAIMVNKYANAGINISQEAAMDEVIANEVGTLMEDSGALENFIAKHKEDRSLIEKLRDVVRRLLTRLRGTGQEKQLSQVERRLSETIDAAVAQVKENTQAQKNAAQQGDGKMSLKYVDGKQVVWIENGDLTNKQLASHTAVAEYIAKHIGEVYTIIESGQRVYIGEDLPGEYTHSKYTDSIRISKPSVLKAKNKAANDFGLLIETASNRRWEKTKHPESKDAKYGMYRYDCSFAFPVKDRDGSVINVRAYDAELLIRNASDGKKYLYDIVNIKENTAKAIDLKQRETRFAAYEAASRGSASATKVPQPTEVVKMENVGTSYDASTESAAPGGKLSLKTWNESGYVQARGEAAKALSKALGVTEQKAASYIDSINSVAKTIADDRARLDYESNLDPEASVLKPNSEYKWSVDMSTLCAKRLLFTGTFDEIQKRLPNTAFDSDDIVKLRKMMQDKGLEVACGICYVESTRREIGPITQEFIERYKIAQRTGNYISRINSEGKQVTLHSKGKVFSADKKYTPTLADLNTTNIDLVKRDHKEVYDAYLAFMNARGQAKPKLLETRAEYKGEILQHFKAKSAVKARNDHGGLRVQSFSDFEVPHMIDMMQIVMDMSRVGLKSQAYTKVPAFAAVFGDTGIKINLSLIAKGSGLDANGNLIFDDVEGINHEEAFKLREQYSKNVGTILVGKNDKHIIAAMADPRIDFIIPFHKSSWKESLYDSLGLTGYADYTTTQNEKPLDPNRKISNFDPSEYWDFTKTGDENAQIYLEKCRKNGRTPKFPQFKDYPGYWKLLIDFKMYDNDGVGSPQDVVRPDFNEAEAQNILQAYEGGHRKLPVAQDVVEEFVSKYEGKLSLKDSEGNTLTKEQAEYFKNSKARDKKGNLLVLYHGTDIPGISEFKTSPSGADRRVGMYLSDNRKVAQMFAGTGADTEVQDRTAWTHDETVYTTPTSIYNLYANVENPLIVSAVSEKDSIVPGYKDYTQHFWDDIPTPAEMKAAGVTANSVTTDAIALFAREHGYDGVIIEDLKEGYGIPGTDVIVFSPEQVKYIDNYEPTTDPDIRFSLKGSEELTREIMRIEKEGAKAGRSEADIRADIRAAVQEVYQGMLADYGAIDPGENPHRDVQVPKRTAKKKKVSQTVRTILEAQATPDAALPKIEEMVAKGEFSYEVYGDKKAISDAETYIRDKGWEASRDEWFASIRTGNVNKRNTTVGWMLYNNAVNAGNVELAMNILNAMVEHQRNAAQAVQATRILKKLAPETQLYGIQRSVKNLQAEINDRFKDKRGKVELKIDEALAEEFMTADTQERRDKVLQEIYKDIGRQMPSTFVDKFRAWRYLAMLGNPRTHVRNIVGNAAFAPVVLAKDLTATGIEAAVHFVSGKKTVKNKGTIDGKLLKAAWADYKNVEDMVVGEGKYSDYVNVNQYIEEGRQIFKNKALEKARRANTKALNVEDIWFSRPHYALAMAQFCKAHGITAEQLATEQALGAARQYAAKEAQKATYRDTNMLSQAISHIGFRNVNGNPVKKGINTVLEGILPFRKTPANILARGIEYSPIGLMNGIKQAVWDVHRGNKTAAEAIDSISAGLTGTGLLALGAYLASQGLIRGRGGDDKDEREFEELMGHQSYALELPNGKSYTLDWLAPEALPFFVGVNLYEQTQANNEEMQFKDMLSAILNVTEPMLEMSCLQGLNDIFESVGYASSNDMNGLMTVLTTSVSSFLAQIFPTLLGQAERIFEPERMSTYTEKNGPFGSDMQYFLGKISGKVPVWEYQQIPFIDAWGRTESAGAIAERAFNNLINPAYASNVEISPMEEELLALYELTGETGILPSRAAKYFTVNGERVDLTADEYVKYAQAQGQTAYKLLTSLVKTAEYQALSDDEKVAAIKEVYEYAKASAKASVSEYEPTGWVAKALDVTKSTGLKTEQYVLLYLQQKNIESVKDADGETIDNSRSLLIMQLVYNVSGLTTQQRQALFEAFGVGKSVIHYNKALVEQKLAEMRGK